MAAAPPPRSGSEFPTSQLGTANSPTRSSERGEAPEPPSSLLERVRKVLAHERRTGLADRAAVGGLEQFLRRLGSGTGLAPPTRAWCGAAARLAAGYQGQPAEARGRVVAQLLAELDALLA